MAGPTEVFEFVKSVGVPAGIAFYVLYRVDKRLEQAVEEFRKFREDMRASLHGVDDLERHITERATWIVGEVEHKFRGVIANYEIRQREVRRDGS